MPFAQINDARIHYDLSGPATKDTLVFSNSLGETLAMWDSQAAALSGQFQVLRYDTRGHGKSSATPGPYTIEQLSRDVLALLDSLHLDCVHFCGLSMGGMTGMWLALHARQRLRKLILCNTAAKIGTADNWNQRIDTVRKHGMKSVSSAVIERWFSSRFRASSPEIASNTQRILEGSDVEGYASNCAAVRDFDARETVASIKVPTLVIAGIHDPATTPEDGRYLAGKIQGARYVELDAAHLSNIEQHERFTAELSAFLSS